MKFLFLLVWFAASQSLNAFIYDYEKTQELKHYLNLVVSSSTYNIKLETSEFTRTIRELVEGGADPNIATDLILKGYSAIHFAANMDHVELIELLVSKGADVNKKDISGCTPLSVACFAGHQKAAIVLIGLNARVNHRDKLENTPMSYACLAGHRELVLKLIILGAKENCLG